MCREWESGTQGDRRWAVEGRSTQGLGNIRKQLPAFRFQPPRFGLTSYYIKCRQLGHIVSKLENFCLFFSVLSPSAGQEEEYIISKPPTICSSLLHFKWKKKEKKKRKKKKRRRIKTIEKRKEKKTASDLKQDPNTYKVQKKAIY